MSILSLAPMASHIWLKAPPCISIIPTFVCFLSFKSLSIHLLLPFYIHFQMFSLPICSRPYMHTYMPYHLRIFSHSVNPFHSSPPPSEIQIIEIFFLPVSSFIPHQYFPSYILKMQSSFGFYPFSLPKQFFISIWIIHFPTKRFISFLFTLLLFTSFLTSIKHSRVFY